MCIQKLYLRYLSDYVPFTAGFIQCLIMFEPKYVIILKRMLHMTLFPTYEKDETQYSKSFWRSNFKINGNMLN